MQPGIAFEIVKTAGPMLGIRSDRTAIVALCQRGPAEEPVLVHSLAQFTQRFGCPLDGTLGALAASGYFANGGEELIVSRFVPDEATEASGVLGVVGTSSSGPLTFFAVELGSFANQFRLDTRVQVRRQARGEASSATQVTFTGLGAALFTADDVGLPARFASESAGGWLLLSAVDPYSAGSQTVTLSSPALVLGEAVILTLYEATFSVRLREPNRAEQWVHGLDLRDLGAANLLLATIGLRGDWIEPGDCELPQPEVIIRLGGGSDGLDPGGNAAALEASFSRAAAALSELDSPDIVVAPDLWSRIWRTKGVDALAFDAEQANRLAQALVLNAADRSDRVVVLDSPLGGISTTRPLGVSELEDWYQTEVAPLGSARDFAAAYAPWLRVVAGPVYQGDDTLLLPPSAHVAGQMARLSRERGPWIAVGNLTLQQGIGLDARWNEADEERLQALGINPLRVVVPRGCTIQGVRALAYPDRKPWAFLSTRRLFNFLRRALTPVGMSYVFEPNAPATWIELRRDVTRLLRGLYDQGGLAGATPREAFFVQVNEALNPEDARENGVLTCRIGVAPAVPLEFLLVRLVVSKGIANVVEEPNVP
ncbi:MAG: phage tail sheath C-terminal domain-containing protein [Polyangiaceae bacterium]